MATPTRAINMIDAGSMIFRRVFIAVSSLRLGMRCLSLRFRLRRGVVGFRPGGGFVQWHYVAAAFYTMSNEISGVFKVGRESASAGVLAGRCSVRGVRIDCAILSFGGDDWLEGRDGKAGMPRGFSCTAFCLYRHWGEGSDVSNQDAWVLSLLSRACLRICCAINTGCSSLQAQGARCRAAFAARLFSGF